MLHADLFYLTHHIAMQKERGLIPKKSHAGNLRKG